MHRVKKFITDRGLMWTCILLNLAVILAFFYHNYAVAVRGFANSIVKVVDRSGEHGGTGFAVLSPNQKKYILTNAHVCQIAKKGKVQVTSKFLDGPLSYSNPIEVDVISVSKSADLCLLTAPAVLPPLVVGRRAGIGDLVTVMGHPLLGELTVSKGEVLGHYDIDIIWGYDLKKCKGKGYEVKLINFGFFSTKACIRTLTSMGTSAVIYPGSSGSPVFNRKGLVVGVIFASNSQTNYGDAVPIEDVVEFLRVY